MLDNKTLIFKIKFKKEYKKWKRILIKIKSIIIIKHLKKIYVSFSNFIKYTSYFYKGEFKF